MEADESAAPENHVNSDINQPAKLETQQELTGVMEEGSLLPVPTGLTVETSNPAVETVVGIANGSLQQTLTGPVACNGSLQDLIPKQALVLPADLAVASNGPPKGGLKPEQISDTKPEHWVPADIAMAPNEPLQDDSKPEQITNPQPLEPIQPPSDPTDQAGTRRTGRVRRQVLETAAIVDSELSPAPEEAGPKAKRQKTGRKIAARGGEGQVPGKQATKPPPGGLKQILQLLKSNTEPYCQNEWRREPWPARPYDTIPEYQVAVDAGEAADKAALKDKLFITVSDCHEAVQKPLQEPLREAMQPAENAAEVGAGESSMAVDGIAQLAEPATAQITEPAATQTAEQAPAQTTETPETQIAEQAATQIAELATTEIANQAATQMAEPAAAQIVDQAAGTSTSQGLGVASTSQGSDEETRKYVLQQIEAHARSLNLQSLPPPLCLGVNIEERPAWGMDCYTHRAITDALSTCKEMQESAGEDGLKEACNAYVQNVLLPAVNQLGKQGWNLRKALEDLCSSKPEESLEAAAARHLLWAVKGADGAYGASRPEHTTTWRLHPKGQGVFATRDIPPGTFVQEYLGELYSPWRWFEKQDLLRKANPNQTLPDFYNICLERPPFVNGGADVVFVEAADRGNFASRLSHSCGPNCRNVAVVVGSRRITNALFTSRPVAAGEELSWDYACVTESEREFRAAICLCGSHACRGSFLYYANSTTFQQVMQQRHTFLDRNALLVRACSEPLEQADHERLAKYGIGSSLLGPDPPAWLQKWAALILSYIELERALLPEALKALKKFEGVATELEADGVKENRLQNLAITLDKLAFFLRHQPAERIHQPPLRVLTEAEILESLWTGPESIWKRASQVATTHLRSARGASGGRIDPAEAIAQIEELGSGEGPSTPAEARSRILQLVLVLRKCGPASAGLADTLLLAGHTSTFFTSTKFEPVKAVLEKSKGKGGGKKGGKGAQQAGATKMHRPSFLWAQCSGWFKQTVFDPTASLSAERRGCLSLPDVETAYSGGGKGSYIEKTRVALLKNLKASPSNMWPTSLPFSFRNSAKVYGSPMLDAAIRASQNPQQSVAGGSDPQLSAVVSEMAAAYVQPQS